MAAGNSSRRGRPRDNTVDRRVLDAAWDLLHEAGFAALTVDEVAERAGVAKTTLYRRWPTKDHLAIALAARILGEVPIAETGDLRRDLTGFTAALAASLDRLRRAGPADGGASAGFAADLVAAAARHRDLGELVQAGFAARHEMALARLQRARDAGQLRPGVDLAILIDQLAGPLWYRVLVTGSPADPGYAERLTAAVLGGAITTKERHP
jgi:AcrR family transcriptional regulator